MQKNGTTGEEGKGPGGKLFRDALAMFRAGLRAADPGACVRKHMVMDGPDTLRIAGRSFFLPDFRRILVLAAGKAAHPMAAAALDVLGNRVAGGLAVTKHGHGGPILSIPLREAGHPVPDRAGMDAAREMLALASSAGPRDLVLFLLSGGASALLCLPAPGIDLADKSAATGVLLASGAPIAEMNALRKHLSAVKGGRLAAACPEAAKATLALSDVIGDDLSVIASGPTVPDPSTFADCRAVMERRGLLCKMPRAVLAHIAAGLRGEVPETPKSGAPAFARSFSLVAGSLAQSLDAAEAEARRLGYHPFRVAPEVSGEARDAARFLCGLGKRAGEGGGPASLPVAVVAGGETVVTLRGRGLGGRNQEMALAAALEMEGLPGLGALFCGTDGTDGPTSAAGAWADGATVPRARAMGLDPAAHLVQNDSHTFFSRAGGLVSTGPTGTNVMDIYLVLASPKD